MCVCVCVCVFISLVCGDNMIFCTSHQTITMFKNHFLFPHNLPPGFLMQANLTLLGDLLAQTLSLSLFMHTYIYIHTCTHTHTHTHTYIYIYIYINIGSISSLMQISLNIIDILCLHIFFWIRSNSRITFIVFGGN